MDRPSMTGAVRRYALPDWGRLDTVWRRSLPFALWKVGEQALLYHWLDDAVDQGVERVVLFVADRPAEVRGAMETATLWPLEWEVRPVAHPEEEAVDDTIDRLPGTPAGPSPADGWDLIRHWQRIEHAWLSRFRKEIADYPIDLAIGRGCDIHPSTRLKAPYWIGDHVSIGPGSVIGPNAVVGDGALVGAGARIENAHLGEGTYLGTETDLVDAVLEGATLLNLKHAARVDRLDQFIAGDTGKTSAPRPPAHERWLAFRLWWHWRKTVTADASAETFTGIDGRRWKLPGGPLALGRRPLLKAVWQGRMRLFGPPPRPAEALRNLPDDWASLLRGAPPGALGYADVMGAAPGTFEEALHNVYMLTDRTGQAQRICLRWAGSLLQSDPPRGHLLEGHNE